MIDAATMKEILSNLSKTRPIFHSEADFQLGLFRKLITEGHVRSEDVYHEYSFGQKNVDIVLKPKEGRIVAIELKYLTKTTCLEAIGECGDKKEWFRLRKGAENRGRYGFWKDIDKLQSFVEANKCIGYAICLTNTTAYEDTPAPDNMDKNFSLAEGREYPNDRVLRWRAPRKDHPDIEIKKSYVLKWEDYDKNHGFRYLLVQIDG